MKPQTNELAKRETPTRGSRSPDRAAAILQLRRRSQRRNEVHLLDYWRAIRKRLWLVFGIVALITMLSVVYVARKPDFYEAQARVQVDLEETGNLVNNRARSMAQPTIRSTSTRNFRSSSVPG